MCSTDGGEKYNDVIFEVNQLPFLFVDDGTTLAQASRLADILVHLSPKNRPRFARRREKFRRDERASQSLQSRLHQSFTSLTLRLEMIERRRRIFLLLTTSVLLDVDGKRREPISLTSVLQASVFPPPLRSRLREVESP